jgi:hypothetical protein
MSLSGVLRFIYCDAECHYSGCRYAECHYAECHYSYAECHYTECHYRYAECHYAECRYSECRGTLLDTEICHIKAPGSCSVTTTSIVIICHIKHFTILKILS